MKSPSGPCQGPAGEHAQYEVTAASPFVPAAMVNSTYVPSCRTTEKALPTPVRRPSPSTGRGRAPVVQAELSQYSQAPGSARPPTGTRAT